MLTHICTYPENLVKIGPVDFEIIGLLSDR